MSDPAPAPASPAPDESASLAQIAGALGIGRYTRHILLCTGPSCCSETQGYETWSTLKTRLKELARKGAIGPFEVYRTKVGCLRICADGPILVVYPEGIWYRRVTPQVCEQILDRLVRGEVHEEYAFARNPLFTSEPPPA